MLKAAGRTGDGRPLVVLGLTGENVTRLLANEPMIFNLSELGLPPTQFVIMGGQPQFSVAGYYTRDDQPLVVVQGISAEIGARLMSERPITFDLSVLRLRPTQVMIVGGRTEADFLPSLRSLGLAF